MKRRDFLALATSLAVAPCTLASTAGAGTLRLAPAKPSLAGAGYPDTGVWAFNATVPGPLLRYRQGERLRIEVENAPEVETTVHWHGLRVPNAMDGVPQLTQPPIAARGGRFLYEFDLPDAGTYFGTTRARFYSGSPSAAWCRRTRRRATRATCPPSPAP